MRQRKSDDDEGGRRHRDRVAGNRPGGGHDRGQHERRRARCGPAVRHRERGNHGHGEAREQQRRRRQAEGHPPAAGEQQPQRGERPDGDPREQQRAHGDHDAGRERAESGRRGAIRASAGQGTRAAGGARARGSVMHGPAGQRKGAIAAGGAGARRSVMHGRAGQRNGAIAVGSAVRGRAAGDVRAAVRGRGVEPARRSGRTVRPAAGGDAGRRRAGGGGRRLEGGLGRPGVGGRPVRRGGIRCGGRPMSRRRIAVPWGRGNGLRHLPTLPASRACGNGRPRSLVRGPVARKGNVDVSYRGRCCTTTARRAAERGSATPPRRP